MSNDYAIVIPTRNRPEQMRAALASCAEGRPDSVRVVVSYPSIESSARDALCVLCATFKATYIQCAEPCLRSTHRNEPPL
ncbi:MAG: hypothetical protein NZ740_07875 [Kiritimatiellae bacterium]|nr:hypothetical protein [Kiritimatiellia bacterium]MDW8459012.1 hypothetical protein [Verrucomicrobiota bacterium]